MFKAGHTGYETWMVDKYNQVQEKASEFTKQFIKPNESSGTVKNCSVEINFLSSQCRNHTFKASVSDVEEPIHSINEFQVPRTSTEKRKSIEKSSELFVHKKRRAGPLRTKKKKTATTISLKENESSSNQTKIGDVKKVAVVKVYRCKYCDWANNNKDLVLSHERTDHSCSVRLNQYYGPNFVKLRVDYMSQIEKLSWPFRKRKYSQLVPASKRNNRTNIFLGIEKSPAGLNPAIEECSGSEESVISQTTLDALSNGDFVRKHLRTGYDTKNLDASTVGDLRKTHSRIGHDTKNLGESTYGEFMKKHFHIGHDTKSLGASTNGDFRKIHSRREQDTKNLSESTNGQLAKTHSHIVHDTKNLGKSTNGQLGRTHSRIGDDTKILGGSTNSELEKTHSHIVHDTKNPGESTNGQFGRTHSRIGHDRKNLGASIISELGKTHSRIGHDTKNLGALINGQLGRTHSRIGHVAKNLVNRDFIFAEENVSQQNNVEHIERPCNSSTPYSESTCKFCLGYLKNVSPQEYLKHLNLEKCNTSQISCTLCREDFSKKPDLLNDHEKNCFQSMSVPKDILCRKCNNFVQSSSFVDHLTTEHKALFKCFICSTLFNQKECLLNHLERCNFKPILRGNFTCAICKCVSGSLKAYKTHFLIEHPSHYLNTDLSLNYRNHSEYENEKKVTDILQPYKIDRYLKSKSDGKYFCGLNNCKKVLNNILQLETHLQKHILRKKKGKAILKSFEKTSVNSKFSMANMMSLYHDYIFKNKMYKSPPEEKEEADPKISFLNFLGLQPSTPCNTSDSDILNEFSSCSSNYDQNIEFSSIRIKYMDDLGIDLPVQYTPNARNENEAPLEIITISDSDDE